MMDIPYNSLLVALVSAIFGGTAAAVGLFTLLARRSMAVDLITHCTLPGMAFAFLLLYGFGISERSLPWLTVGGIGGGMVGLWIFSFIKRHSRLRDDSLLSSMIGWSFGIGIVLLSAIQTLPVSSQAGLEDLLLGSAATITLHDGIRMAFLASVSAVLLWFYRPAFTLMLMDPVFTDSIGWNRRRLEFILLCLVLAVVMSGLTAAGLILVLSLTIIPPAAALLLHRSMGGALVTAIILGALSSAVGVGISSWQARVPAGSMITLTALSLFLLAFVVSRLSSLYGRWRASGR